MTALSRDVVGSLDVSRETMASLRAFEAEVRRWTPVVNLVSRVSLDDLWSRHVEDSAQIFRACPPGTRRWLDLGSGGGFPGLVVAILARELQPDLRVTLVESDQRKAVFLRQTAQKLDLDVTVLAKRIETLPPQGADIVSARALASLADLLDLAAPHLKPDGIALFLKGARHADEIAEARATWTFDLDSRPSLSDPDAALLILRKVHRAKLP
jgi:16S rRNA (guanine527-N7)-methyltransferase